MELLSLCFLANLQSYHPAIGLSVGWEEEGGARLIVDLGDDLLGCCKCLSHGGGEGRNLQGVCTGVLPETHAHTLPLSLCHPLSFSRILGSICRGCESCYWAGQWSGTVR